MTKEPKLLGPDDSGYVSTGIYSYFEGNSESHPEEHEKNRAYHAELLLESTDEMLGRVERDLAQIIDARKSELPTLEERKADRAFRGLLETSMFAAKVRKDLSRPAEYWTATDGSLSYQLIKDVFRLGELYERARVRKYEPAVYIRKKSEAALNSEDTVEKRHRLKAEAEAALEHAKTEFPNKTLTVQKQKAAESIGISKRSLDRRLKYSDCS